MKNIDDNKTALFYPDAGKTLGADGASYFAAANGFDGFRSNFDTLFRPDRYERIYVLKGGPGTGKSTLLKSCAALGEARGVRTLRVRCSSDAASLDGVIYLPDGRRPVALLDGTAPHERDAIVAGAIDRLIDLGDYRRDDELAGRREEILALNAEKSEAYRKGYGALSIAGIFFRKIFEETAKGWDADAARRFAARLIDERPAAEQREADLPPEGLLLSCFGKDGYASLSLPESDVSVVQLCGTPSCRFLMIDALLQVLRERAIPCRVFSSPLDPALAEAVLIPSGRTLFRVGQEDGGINADLPMKKRAGLTERESDLLRKEENQFFSLAVSYFAAASECHFKLEKHYTAAMDFAAIDAARRDLLDEISDLVS